MAKVVKTIKVKIHNPNKGKQEALKSTVEILTEIEKLTLKTKAHPEPEINLKTIYPNLPTSFRRSVINTSIGMCKSYLRSGERFSYNSLFRCGYCGYVANADFNASVNLSFGTHSRFQRKEKAYP